MRNDQPKEIYLHNNRSGMPGGGGLLALKAQPAAAVAHTTRSRPGAPGQPKKAAVTSG